MHVLHVELVGLGQDGAYVATKAVEHGKVWEGAPVLVLSLSDP